MSNLLFVVVLEILSGRTPPATRLRLFPKHALKGFGIRCLSIRAVDGDKTPGGGGVGGVSVTDGGGGTERGGPNFPGWVLPGGGPTMRVRTYVYWIRLVRCKNPTQTTEAGGVLDAGAVGAGGC